MAYRKAEVRRESETKIILITTARATQHIKRRTAKDIVPRGDDFAVCARARSDASSAGVGEGGGGLAAVGGWRRGSLQWAFVGRLAQIQTQRRQFVLRTVSGYTLYMYIKLHWCRRHRRTLYIIFARVCAVCPRTLHRGGGHRVQFPSRPRLHERRCERWSGGKRGWVRRRIDGEKPPSGTPSSQQCVIRWLTPSPIYQGKRMYDLYYIYCTYIYIYIRVVFVCYIMYHERILLLVYVYFNTIFYVCLDVCQSSFSLCAVSFAVSAMNSKANFYTHRMVYRFRYILFGYWATKVTDMYQLSWYDRVNAVMVLIAVECTNSRVQSTTQSESKFGRKNPPLEWQRVYRVVFYRSVEHFNLPWK